MSKWTEKRESATESQIRKKVREEIDRESVCVCVRERERERERESFPPTNLMISLSKTNQLEPQLI